MVAIEVLKPLQEAEESVLEKANELIVCCNDCEAARNTLQAAISEYNSVRERIQKEIWEKKEMGWCRRCKKACPKKDLTILYVEEEVKTVTYPHEEYETTRVLQRLCRDCFDLLTSYPEKQCSKVKEKDGEFLIYQSGEWHPLSQRQITQVQIELSRVPEEAYTIGKRIYSDFNLGELSIGEKKII